MGACVSSQALQAEVVDEPGPGVGSLDAGCQTDDTYQEPSTAHDSHQELSTSASITAGSVDSEACAFSSASFVSAVSLDDDQQSTLTSLPAELLNGIISFADQHARMALFRCCKEMRDAVLAHAAVSWSQQLQTRLLLEPESGKRSSLWQSNIGVYTSGTWHWLEHPSIPSYVQVEDKAGAVVTCLQNLPAVPIKPRQQQRQQQHITTIRIQGVQMTNPLPQCIGHSCASLRNYKLQHVTWPQMVSEPTSPWPQLQHLTLSYTSTTQLPELFNTTTLPGLCSLRIKADGFQMPWMCKDSAIAGCCLGFKDQLARLSLNTTESAVRSMLVPILEVHATTQHSTPIFTQLTTCTIIANVNDQLLTALLMACPALTHLKISHLELFHSHAALSCGIVQLELSCLGNYCSTLARLPRMPQLGNLRLPSLLLHYIHADPQQAADAAAALHYLPASSFRVDMGLYTMPTDEVQLTSKLSALAPFLRLLSERMQLTLNFEIITATVLRALGAAQLPRICFHSCTWEPEELLSQLWSLLPHTIEVVLPHLTLSEEVLQLCRSATRHVTVSINANLCGERRWKSLQREVDALGNRFVSLQAIN